MPASFLPRLHCNAPVDGTVPSAEDGGVTMDLVGHEAVATTFELRGE